MTDDELRNLVNNYQPNVEVRQTVSKLKILATVGPSASGKTTIAQALVRSSMEVRFVLGETTRPARFGERPDIDYLFRTKEEVISDIKNGSLIDVIIGPNGDLYCTRLSSFPQHGFGVMALVPSGVKKFAALGLEFFKTAFIVPDTYERWQQWLAKQAEVGQWTPEHWGGRLAEAKESHEFALSDPEINFVLNDTPDKAAARLAQILNGQKPSDEEAAKTAAQGNYQKLLTQLAVK